MSEDIKCEDHDANFPHFIVVDSLEVDVFEGLIKINQKAGYQVLPKTFQANCFKNDAGDFEMYHAVMMVKEMTIKAVEDSEAH